MEPITTIKTKILCVFQKYTNFLFSFTPGSKYFEYFGNKLHSSFSLRPLYFFSFSLFNSILFLLEGGKRIQKKRRKYRNKFELMREGQQYKHIRSVLKSLFVKLRVIYRSQETVHDEQQWIHRIENMWYNPNNFVAEDVEDQASDGTNNRTIEELMEALTVLKGENSNMN